MLYEREKYKVLIGCIMDICDGLSKVHLLSLGVEGHGKKYYLNEDKIFIAEISELYNLDGVDILYHIFGEELALEIVNFYNQFIGIDTCVSHNR